MPDTPSTIFHNVDPRDLTQLESHDGASIIWQALGTGGMGGMGGMGRGMGGMGGMGRGGFGRGMF